MIVPERYIQHPIRVNAFFPFTIGGLELPSQPLSPTQVAELVDALVSNTSDASRAGSIPALGTILNGSRVGCPVAMRASLPKAGSIPALGTTHGRILAAVLHTGHVHSTRRTGTPGPCQAGSL